MKDWLTVIIVLLIVGIVLDGIRRARLARRENISLSKNAKKADLESEVNVSTSEFPSGGARVATRRDEDDAATLNDSVKKNFQAGRNTAGAPNKIPEQVSLNLEESVPMLMDSVDEVNETETTDAYGESAEQVENEADEIIRDEHHEPQIGSLEDLYEEEPEPEIRHSDISKEASETQFSNTGESPGADSETSYGESLGSPSSRDYKKAEPEPKPEPKKDTSESIDESEQFSEPDEVLIMNVMAKAGQRFAGEDLLSALMNEGLKFGDMDIFHRHKDNDGDAPIIFSLANMVVPGTFNLAEMEGFETPGVSLFLSLPVPTESLAAYEDLAKTAKNLSDALGGELKDENRSVMTSQTIEHGRQRVIEYERKKKLARV